MKKITLFFLFLLSISSFSSASIMDAPHNETFNIRCGDCHSYSFWWQYSPIAPLDEVTLKTASNTMCMKCHDGTDPNRSVMRPHSSDVLGTGHGVWSSACIDCHSYHNQDQLFWRTDNPNELYLVSGTINSAILDAPQIGQSTIYYSSYVVNNTNWNTPDSTDPTAITWSRKNLSPPDQGLILVHDTTEALNTYSILSVDSANNEIVINGKIDPTLIIPTASSETFGLIYGQQINSNIVNPNNEIKEVQFFDPNTTYSSGQTGGFVADAANLRQGICQACHTSTLYWTANGLNDNHNLDRNCSDCHLSEIGFQDLPSTSNTDHSASGNGSVLDSPTCVGICHPTNAPMTIHKRDCTSCHTSISTIPALASFNSRQYVSNIISGNCLVCHGNYSGFGSHNFDHSKSVLINKNQGTTTANCIACHTATTAPFIIGNEVHSATPSGESSPCANCHLSANGSLTGSAANLTADRGECSACHLNYFPSHEHGTSTGTNHWISYNPVRDISNGEGCLLSCHTNLVGSLDAIINGHTSSGQCGTCHNSNRTNGASITVNPSYTSIANAITQAGSTNNLQLNCIDCHWDRNVEHLPDHSLYLSGGTTTCVTNCHTDLFSVDANDPKVHDSCTTCHTGTLSPVTLIGSAANHRVPEDGAKNDCLTCHTTKTFDNHIRKNDHLGQVNGTSDGSCDACHPSTMDLVMNPLLHNSACSLCHNLTNGGILQDGAKGIGSAIGGAGNCADCHASFSSNFFNHPAPDHNTSYVLDTPTCTYCHDESDRAEGVHAVNSCDNCHDPDSGLLRAGTNGDATGGAGDCASCHPQRNADYANHNPVDHNIDIIFTTESCVSCHNETDQANGIHATNGCDTCHAPLTGELLWAPNGNALGGVGDCESCHLARSINFTNHTPTTHPGITDIPNCTTTCHTGESIVSDLHDCSSCHAPLVNWVLQGSAIYGPGDCVYCHNGVAPTDSHIAQHDSTGFDNTPSLPCADCHDVNVATEHMGRDSASGVITCDTCHDPAFILYQEKIELGKQGVTIYCRECHGYMPGNHPLNLKNLPVANDDVYELFERTTDNALDVLVNDTDADPDDVLTITSVSAASNGGTVTINANGDALLYTPAAIGVESFTYTVFDTFGLSDNATVAIIVNDVDPPVVMGDSYILTRGNVLDVPAPGVLDNDADPEGAPLTAELIAAPLHHSGTFILNPDGSFTYSHDGSVDTTDSFTYRANDGALDSTPATVILNIDSGSPGTIDLTQTSHILSEDGGTITVTAARTGGSGGTVSVSYSTSGGTATANVDYNAASGTLTWVDGDMANKTFTITVIDDTANELDETVNITISNPTNGALLGTQDTALLTITDNDPIPTIAFRYATSAQPEATSPGLMAVELSAASGKTVSVDYIVSGTAAGNGVDYTLNNGTLIFSPGESSKDISAIIVNDTVFEADETIIVTLSSPSNAALLGELTHTYTITNDDIYGVISLSSSTYTSTEGDIQVTITATRTNGSTGSVGADYATSNGTATEGSDYTAASGTLSWADGDTADKTFTITILEDDRDELDETVNITLSAPTPGAALGTTSSAVLTITDNDLTPTVAFDLASSIGSEAIPTATMTVSLSAASNLPITVDYQVSGTATAGGIDFTLANGTLTFLPDEISKDISAIIVDDTLVEPDEIVIVTLLNPINAFMGGQSIHGYTISNDDLAGALSFSAPTYIAAEDGGSATITVTRTGGSIGAVEVTYVTSNGTASAGFDYTAATGTLSWVDGETADKTFTILITNDTDVESSESVNIALTAPTGGAILGATNTAVLTITDDDTNTAGTITLTAANFSVTEGDIIATIIARRTGGAAGIVGVNYTTSDGTALEGSDYTAASGTLIWTDGDMADKLFTISMNDDSFDELSETVDIAINSPSGGATLGTPNTAVLTISDNDPTPSVAFATASSGGIEAITPIGITVNLSAASNLPITVDYQVGGTATGGGIDYTLNDGTLTFNPGETSLNITADIVADSTIEPDELIIVSLSNPSNATLGIQNIHGYTIINDDSAGIISLSASAYVVAEDGISATITVQRSGGSSGVAGISYATSDGTAFAGFDYTTESGSLSWADGETADKSFTILITNDTDIESNETVNISLTSPTGGATLGSPNTAVLTITDDEVASPGSITLSAPTYTVAEGNNIATITARRISGSAGLVGVSYATSNETALAGSDYTSVSNTLSWADGDTADKVFTVSIINDSLDESDETLNIALTLPTGGATLGSQDTAVLTITDDDPEPLVSFTAASSSGTESTTPALMTVDLSTASGLTVIVGYTVTGTATGGGDDYTLANGSLTFTPGVTSQEISAVIINDSAAEADETIIVTLSPPVNGTLGTQTDHTYTIINDDLPGSIALSAPTYSVNEGGTSVTITATRTGGSSGTVSVSYATSDGTAEAGSDYTTATGSLIWADGETADKTFVLAITDDAQDELDETVTITLSAPTGGATLGGQDTAEVTITDNDPAPSVAFASPSSSGLESVTPAVLTVNLSAASNLTVTVNYLVSGSAIGGGNDHNLANGILVFNPGVTSQEISTAIVTDTVVEADETLIVTLTTPTYATLGGQINHTYTIINDDFHGSIALSAPTYTIAESGPSITITATRSGGSSGMVGVSYATSNGTAAAGVDYTASSGNLSWADGETADKTFTIDITEDTSAESDETVNIVITAPTGGATLGSPNTAVLTITDNDTPIPGTLSLTSSTYTITEAGPTITITTTRSGGADGAVAVDFATADLTATAGSDYEATSGTLSWADQESGDKTFVITILEDSVYEGDETLDISLSGTTGGALLGISSAVLTITENDPPAYGTIALTSSTYSITEAGPTVTITATRSGGSDLPVSVDFATSNGSATAGSDYTSASGTLTWADTESGSKTFAITILEDAIYEGDETVNINLSNVSGAALGTSSAVLTITENDAPAYGTISLSSSTYSITEAGPTVTITATRSGGSDLAVSVDFATSNGSATAGSDYNAASGTLTWADTESGSKTFAITILEDAIYEGDETVNINLSNVSGAALGTSSAVLTITENDAPAYGTISLSSSTYSITEAGPTVTITATRSGGSDLAVSVDFATSNGSATAGSDYNAASGTLTWADTESGSKTFAITILEDAIYEGDETVNINLSNVSGAALGSSSAVLTITENDAPAYGTIALSSSTYSITEAGPTVTITATRSGGSDLAVSVDFATSNGSATAGSDYNAASGTLTWADTESGSKTFAITILEDAIYEGDETVNINLSNVSGAALGISSAVLTITENDSPTYGTISLTSTTYSISEAGPTVTIAASRTGGSYGIVSVDYATSNGTASAGSDYTATSGTLAWGDGDTANKSFSITITNDNRDELDETVNIAISNPVGGAGLGSPNAAVLSIIDDDPTPSLAFTAASSSGSESTSPASMTVNLSAASNLTVTANYSISGTATGGGVDHTLANGTLSFNPGVTSQNMSATIINDSLVESNETIIVTLSTPTNATLGGQSSHTYTILNDDAYGSISLSSSTYSVNENGGTVTITAKRSAGSAGAVGISYATSNGTALAGSDYTAASGTLSWSNGDTANKTFTIAITNDSRDELNETVNIAITSPTGGASLGSPNTAVLTIVDNDPPPSLAFAAASSSGPESASPATMTVNLSAASNLTVTVNYTVSGTATGGGVDYTLANGTLTFNAGVTSQNISAAINNDSLIETDESIIVTLSSPANASLGGQIVHTYTINNDDTPTDTIVAGRANWTSGAGTCDIDPNGTYIEAENFSGNFSQGSGVFNPVNDGTANGGRYLVGSSGATGNNPANEIKTYSVNFTSTGTYYVHGRLQATSGSDDSLFINIMSVVTPGDASWKALNLGGTYGSWVWSNSMQVGSNNSFVISSTGQTMIQAGVREAGTFFDGLYISTSATPPTGGIPVGATVLDPNNCGGGSTTIEILAVNTIGTTGGNVVHADYNGNTYDLTNMSGNRWSFSGAELSDTYVNSIKIWSDQDTVGQSYPVIDNGGPLSWDTISITSAEWDGTDTVVTATNTWDSQTEMYADYNNSGPLLMTNTGGNNWTITFNSVPYSTTVEVTNNAATNTPQSTAVTDLTAVAPFADWTEDFDGNTERQQPPTLQQWTTGSSQTNNWMAEINATTSSKVGPTNFTNAPYIYVEASNNSPGTLSSGAQLWLESPALDASAYDLVLDFDYSMEGINSNTYLEVLVDDGGGFSRHGSIIQTGPAAAGWHNTVIDLSGYSSSTMRIRIQYVMGTGTMWNNDVALDNITINGTP